MTGYVAHEFGVPLAAFVNPELTVFSLSRLALREEVRGRGRLSLEDHKQQIALLCAGKAVLSATAEYFLAIY